MANKKYYFASVNDELCYPLSCHMDMAKYEGLSEIELYEAIPDKTSGMFFCRYFNAVGENGSCGKECMRYEPRNGKSGMCRHRSNKMFTYGDVVKFKVK